MNRAQLVAVWVAIVVVVVLLLFPPWRDMFDNGVQMSTGYAFVFAAPVSEIPLTVDIPRLVPPILAVAAVAAGLYVSLGRKSPKPPA